MFGGLKPKKPKTTANLKFLTGFFRFFSVFPLRQILTGLTGSDYVVLILLVIIAL